MNLDDITKERERVRVDELRLRRKAFLSYPEGSKERKAFLKEVKRTELEAFCKIQDAIPYDLFQTLRKETSKVIITALTKGAAWLLLGVACFIFTSSDLPTLVKALSIAVQVATIVVFGYHIYDAVDLYRKFRRFKKRRDEVGEKVEQTLEDLRKLG